MSNNSTSRRSFRDLFGQRMLCRLSGLLTLCWFTVAAQALYAQNPVISLTLKNATVREVIEAVKTQSGYSFWYRESEIDLRKRVSVEAHDQNVLKLLDGVLADQGILAKLEGRHIVLYKSDPAGRGREYQLKGRVETEAGDPIVGANVLVEGTTNGMVTNSKGEFALNVTAGARLSVSFIGYAAAQVEVGNRTHLTVVLKENNQLLDDVVVIGYGVQKKVNLTGSVAVRQMSEIENQPMTHASQALYSMPGVYINQASSKPGSDGATIRIRGVGTMSSSSPMVLVDGMEYSLNELNPGDIETISVLKDASASIYGSKAANGVILITTKNGSSGKAQISYSYKGILQMPYNDLHFVSDYARHMELINESCDNIGTSRIFSQSNIDLWREKSADPYGVGENGVPNFALYPNTDWCDEIFEKGYSQEHNLSISGGAEKIRYLLSLGYLDNQGVMGRFGIDSSTQKVNFRTNLEADVTKWFTAGVRLFGQRQEYGLANISGAFNALYQTTPGVYPGSVNAWGRPALAAEESSNANNIFGMMYGSGGYNNSTRVNGSVYATIRPYKGVSVEATVNYSPTFGERHSYGRENGYWDYTPTRAIPVPTSRTPGFRTPPRGTTTSPRRSSPATRPPSATTTSACCSAIRPWNTGPGAGA